MRHVGWRWSVKPPLGTLLDPGHPLTEGLVFCVPFWEGAGDPHEVITGRILTPNTGYGWQTRAPHGTTYDNKPAGTTAYISSTLPWPVANGPFTVAYGYTPRTTNHWVFGLGSVGTNDQLVHCGVNQFTLTFNMFFDDLSVSATNPDDTYMDVVLTLDPSKVQSIYKNSQYLGSRTASSFFVGNNTVHIGRRGDEGASASGRFNYVYIWTRALPHSEVAALRIDPYQMFAPPVWRRYFVVTAGGATLRRYSLPLTGVG